MSLSFIILLFFVYSFIGWVSETLYCSTIEKRFVYRGFLYGPLCPIYGFGGLLIVLLLKPFIGNVFVLFIMAMIVTSILEYVSSWILETVFKTKWWDYSHFKLNLNGRVCLLNSTLFGIMGVGIVHYAHPFIITNLQAIPEQIQEILSIVLSSIIFVDFIFTLRSLIDFADKLAQLSEYLAHAKESNVVRAWIEEKEFKTSLTDLREKLKAKETEVENLLSIKLEGILTKSKSMNRLLSAFPRMMSHRHNDQLNLFKNFLRKGKIRQRINKRKSEKNER